MFKYCIKAGCAIVFTLLVCFIIYITVVNLAGITGIVVMEPLRYAKISIPWWLSVIIGGSVCFFPWKKEQRVTMVIIIVIAVILVIFFTFYFTKVNGIPFGTMMKILLRLTSSGALEGVL